MPRTSADEFSKATKIAAFERCGGYCEECGFMLGPKNPAEYDHDKEVWEGGTNDPENCIVRGKECCHKRKSAASTKRRAKANRCRDVIANVKVKSRRPMPGSRDSEWKKCMNGQTVRRT